MWGKTNERETRPSATPLTEPKPSERLQTPAQVPTPAPSVGTFGKTLRLQGQIHSEEELYLDGELEGEIVVRQRLTVGPNGKVKANVKAHDLVVRGSIQGNVEARDRIVIMKGASIVGDVKTAGIVIEDGAYFKGGIDILRADVKKPETVAT